VKHRFVIAGLLCYS